MTKKQNTIKELKEYTIIKIIGTDPIDRVYPKEFLIYAENTEEAKQKARGMDDEKVSLRYYKIIKIKEIL